ncbi:zinc finger protein 862-like isoform X1 [Alosa sapidissima]|uniref:zinc finger protein 862-like isoform X1 n=1 Tax=Alosa sapidissima TaxID=34773 RepID=UPI001C09BFD5|nr:zinc finger protein 862-like isoform X1 [Alosa sapidissima]XP_041954960.1 zinc finger protein 862-like isoform X1 [Alosa sapidissima]
MEPVLLLMHLKTKCVAFGADGAAVNMGVHRGVIALLKRDVGNHVIPIHCMPHRLELAILNLQRKDAMVTKVYDLLHLVWKTYHFSPKSRRELNTIGEELGVGICTPSSVKGTRWIPHVHRALNVLLRAGRGGNLATDSGQYAAIHHHMEHLASSAANADIQGRAKKIRKEMHEVNFCAFSHFLADVFHELASLSCILQRNDLILPQAVSEIRKTVMVLQAMQGTPKRGGILCQFLASLPGQQMEEVTFQGVPLSGDVTGNLGNQKLKKNMTAVIAITVEALNTRFGSLINAETQDYSVVNCFTIFNHDTWPENSDELLNYGSDKVEALVEHFSDVLTSFGCQLEAIQEEWQSVKALISHTFQDKSYRSLWQMLLTKEPYKTDYKNLLHLVEILLILPISAAQCERGFSAQKRIKSSLRSSLHVSTTVDLIRISTEGPSLERFDPTKCAENWLSAGKRSRRPGYKAWPSDSDMIFISDEM